MKDYRYYRAEKTYTELNKWPYGVGITLMYGYSFFTILNLLSGELWTNNYLGILTITWCIVHAYLHFRVKQLY